MVEVFDEWVDGVVEWIEGCGFLDGVEGFHGTTAFSEGYVGVGFVGTRMGVGMDVVFGDDVVCAAGGYG